MQQTDGTPEQRDTLQQADGTPRHGNTSQQTDGMPKDGNTLQQTKVKRSERTKGKDFRATIHIYKTYVTRQIHADKLVSQELSPNPMAFATSKADEDTMYLHQARKEQDWKNFEEAMAKELRDHQDQEHWSVIPGETMPKGTKAMKSMWLMKHK